jgi:DNA-binding LytR/AlgR family response regulator
MIRAIAIDDEPSALDVLKIHCEDIPSISLIASFTNPIKALDFLKKEKVDLIFLDINMPKISGIDLLKNFRLDSQIILTTAYSEYALESYEHSVTDYLMKPIRFDRLLKSIDKVEKQLKPNSSLQEKADAAPQKRDWLLLKCSPETFKVQLDDIIYLESDGNYIHYHLRNEKKIMVRSSMNQALSNLPSEDFIQVHKSFIVAIAAILSFEKHELKVVNQKIPIGQSYRSEFLHRFK